MSAAAALTRAHARELRTSARAVRALHRELRSDDPLGVGWIRIEQAKGMVMATRPCTGTTALTALFQAAQTGGRTLFELAATLVDQVSAGVPVAAALDALSNPDPLASSPAALALAPAPTSETPNSGSGGAGLGVRPAAGEAVARAVAFIDSHLDCDIAAAQIVAAAGIGARSLQQAFRAHLGATPTGYLRDARLARAHQDLLAAHPDTDTVTGIAARWRFDHAGRFAEAYRRAYGRHPSHTLRHARPRVHTALGKPRSPE